MISHNVFNSHYGANGQTRVFPKLPTQISQNIDYIYGIIRITFDVWYFKMTEACEEFTPAMRIFKWTRF